jgi:hypothetical protein
MCNFAGFIVHSFVLET